MDIVIDSCTGILIAKASVIEIFLKNYNILVTTEVYREILKGKEKLFKDALLFKKLKEENKIKIVKSDNILTKKLELDFNMGEGEASVIALGIKDKIIVATDNRQGRKAAEINNLPLIGSIEIIISLFKKNKIDYEKAITSLKILKEEGWFSNYLIEKGMEDIQNERS